MKKVLYPILLTLILFPLKAQDKPNIIVIFTDDHGWADLGVNGVVDDILTPNLDSLAAAGIRFTDGYVSAPQCIPSRAGIISGQYQQNFGVDDNRFGPMPEEINTIPERLQTAGYTTGHVGKWHLDPNVDSQEWLLENTYAGQTLPPRNQRVIPFSDKLPYYPGNQGFEEYFNGQMSTYWANYDLNGNDLNPDGENQQIPGRDRLDIQSDAALAFIDRNHENPFFLYLAYFAPHVPLASTEKYLSRFPGEMPERRRYALAMISAVDEGVGRIRTSLNDYGILDNTIIFFIGDNGAPLAIHMEDRPLNENGWDGSLNEPFRGEKGMLSEGGIRVPFLMSWPEKLEKGKVSGIPVSSLDVGATSIAAAGLEPDSVLDGEDILDLMNDSELAQERPLFWRFWGQSAVRQGPWKYLRAGDMEFLFNLENDSTESENLVDQNNGRRTHLKDLLEEWNSGLMREEVNTLNGGELAWYQHYFSICEGDHEWDFDDLEKWKLNDRLTGSASEGMAFLSISGEDPYMNWGGTVCINTDSSKYLVLKAKNLTDSNAFALYYINSVTGKWNFKQIFLSMDDSDVKTYVVDMSDEPGWTGNINTVRLDPPGKSGNFDLDYFGILTSDEMSMVVGLKKQEDVSALFSLYPNPANDQINIELGGTENARAEISTVHGQLVTGFELSPGINRLPLDGIKNGVYIIQVSCGLTIHTVRFMKQ